MDVKMTVKSILINWLREQGYDGLCGEECGCGFDDLMSFCETPAGCVPAYKCKKGLKCDHEDNEIYCSLKPESEACVAQVHRMAMDLL